LAVPAVGSSKKSSPESPSLLNALDVEKPVVCPKELRNARGVQLRNLRLDGTRSSSSSSGIEACRLRTLLGYSKPPLRRALWLALFVPKKGKMGTKYTAVFSLMLKDKGNILFLTAVPLCRRLNAICLISPRSSICQQAMSVTAGVLGLGLNEEGLVKSKILSSCSGVPWSWLGDVQTHVCLCATSFVQ
jgi:hypothetical protein